MTESSASTQSICEEGCVDSFDTYEMTNDAPNNPNYVPIETIATAFAAHREALKE